VLRFESQALTDRWQQIVDAGASWDYEDYKPHVTISFDAPDIDVDSIEPYAGELVFGPEIFAELKEDWKDTITEKHTPGGHEHDQQSHAGSGGGSEKDDEGRGEGEGKTPEPSAEAMAVGGDEWNKQTAERLEKEYVEAEPALKKIVSDALNKDAQVEEPPEAPDPDSAPFVPDEWASMSEDQQEYVFTDWKAHTQDSYYQSEVESWQENSATDDAGNQLEYEFGQGENTEWAESAISDFIDDNEGIPFTKEQLFAALLVTYEGSGYNDFHKGLEISFDDSKLKPEGFDDAPTLPGIEPQKPEDFLTKEMREGLTKELSKAFAKEGESVLDKLEPPDYLNESVAEYQEQSWSEMSDKEKFAFAEAHSDVIKNLQQEYDDYFGDKPGTGATGTFYMPNKLDPMQEGNSSSDYTATQKVARYLSVERAAQVMVERGAYDSVEKARGDATRMDNMLWNGWKGSSTSIEGQLLQRATADELGGRLNPAMVTLNPTGVPGYAPNAAPGKAYDAVKAYVRGKWETSQFMLKKAGLETVEVYRAINIPDSVKPTITNIIPEPDTGGIAPGAAVRTVKTFDTIAEAERYTEDQAAKYGKDYSGFVDKFHNVYQAHSTNNFPDREKAEAFVQKYTTDPNNPEQHRETVGTPPEDLGGGYTHMTHFERLPDMHIDRNGAASATTNRTVANAWDGNAGRVVLRASVPRTAVVSVPAYGINVQGEHEVVIAGTAWKGWDAWAGTAPEFDRIKIGHQVVGDPRAEA